MRTISDYGYILATIFLTVYGQIVLKWRVNTIENLPSLSSQKLQFVFVVLTDPFIVSAFIAAFLASLSWMGAMSKFELSHAYPFMSLNFVLVVALSALVFHESISMYRFCGLLLIVIGTVVAAKG